jgi:hypothetical protein
VSAQGGNIKGSRYFRLHTLALRQGRDSALGMMTPFGFENRARTITAA